MKYIKLGGKAQGIRPVPKPMILPIKFTTMNRNSVYGLLYQRLVTVTEKEQVMVLRTAPHYLTFAVLPLGLCSIEHGLCI